MQPWTVDADDLKFGSDADVLHRTTAIDDFLSVGNEQFIVVATKGFGKTLLLKAQRLSLQERGVLCLPENTLIDKPVGDKIFSKRMIQVFGSSTENWQRVWLISIVAASAKVLGLTEGLTLESRLEGLLENEYLRSPIDYFVNVIDLPRNELFRCANEVDTLLIPRLRSTGTSVAIFIDSVDEYFNKHLLSFGSSDAGELSPDIWYYSQMGLVEAAYRLRRISHHLKVFVSVRKEAFARFDRTTSMVQQYRGSTVDLSYGPSSLREIFVANINRERKKNLVEPGLQRSDPVRSFLGVGALAHTHTLEEEEVFEYIYRHTLGRPRDLMTIGSELSDIPPAERTSEAIKKAVNSAATEIAREYLNEIEPYTQGIDFDPIFEALHGNVIPAEDLAATVGGRDEPAFALFCNSGLLGRVEVDPATLEKTQAFVSPGERNLDQDEVIPDSTHYLIHPILAELICARNPRFVERGDRINIVGKGRRWRESDPERELCVLKGDIQGYSKIMATEHGEEEVGQALEKALSDHAGKTLHAEVTDGDCVTIVHDDPSRLLKAARRIMEDLHEAPGQPLLRIAIDRGRIRIKRDEEQRVRAMGDPLRRAARIEPKVQPGQIWVTEAFKDALEKTRAFYRAVPVEPPEAGEGDGRVNIKKPGSTESDDWLHLFRIEG